MQDVITQAAISAAVVVVRVIREADPTAELHTRRSTPEEHNRARQAEPTLIFNQHLTGKQYTDMWKC